jgi:hypothetical protein
MMPFVQKHDENIGGTGGIVGKSPTSANSLTSPKPNDSQAGGRALNAARIP